MQMTTVNATPFHKLTTHYRELFMSIKMSMVELLLNAVRDRAGLPDAIFKRLLDSYNNFFYCDHPSNSFVDQFVALGSATEQLNKTLQQFSAVWNKKKMETSNDGTWKISSELNVLAERWADQCRIYNEIAATEEYLAGKKERELKRRIHDIQSRVPAIGKGLQQTLTEVRLAAPTLGQLDISLCRVWGNIPDFPPQVAKNNGAGDLYRASAVPDRLRAARQAELATAIYYAKLGCTVEDISISQLRNKDVRWRDYDLAIDGEPVDVKNARRLPWNPSHYVRHTIPRFKRDRYAGRSVTIVGVLTDSDHDYRLGRNCQILGETNREAVTSLQLWIKERFGEILDPSGLWDPDYQPGWIFQHCSALYLSRQKAIDELNSAVLAIAECGCEPLDLPKWMLGLCEDEDFVRTKVLSDVAMGIWRSLRSLNDGPGLTLPAIYSLVLGTILEAIVMRCEIGEACKSLNSLLFEERSDEQRRPLGLLDSERYVTSLITMLRTVADSIVAKNEHFTAFKMTHPSILRSKRENGNWMTLVAYCGGRLDNESHEKCGNAPLYLGSHEICPECSRLICNKCGSCSPQCNAYLERQREEAIPPSLFDDPDYLAQVMWNTR